VIASISFDVFALDCAGLDRHPGRGDV